MTLFDLALKNIRRNMKSYGLYIGSTIFSIIIYFTFAMLKHSDDISGLAETSKQMQAVMSASAFVLMIFVAIFILYSNSFFMKKRKKEVALYSLLGVRKRSIGFLLFFENIVIGLIALVIGVGLGFLLSQALLALLLKLMGLSLSVGFAFSMQAVIETVVVFFLIFLVTSLLGYRVIYKFKLIDLFHAEKKGEVQPKARILSALNGVLALAGAYWLALQDLMTSSAWRIFGLAMPLIIIGFTILGSYLLFNSVLVYVLNLLKKSKNWAWKGLNLMTSSQLLYRIRGNAKTLTIIATLSATTITAGGAIFGTYYNTEKNVEQFTPFSFMWEGEEQDIDSGIVEDAVSFEAKDITIEGEVYDQSYYVIDEETFMKLTEALGWDVENVDLAKDEVIMADPFYDERLEEKAATVEVGNDVKAVDQFFEQPLFNIQTLPGITLVMDDASFQELDGGEGTYQAVQTADYKDHLELSKELEAKTEHFSSAVQSYQDSIESSGAMLFVGSFLGLVFLVATGSIIFFKMMTEAEEDKGKYTVLYKIGVSKKEMKKTVRYQVGLIFLAPLVLGLMHGAVALMAFSNLLDMNLWEPVIIWMAAYTLIYILYYVVTVRGFNKTITQNAAQEG
ncbi:Bacitracin export permease protein BceB [Oceanobacillus oncorhynchi]|uniref:Bacitracin export permease protein BceB n=2 Tax=Oceanobacillus oncorhynchi TaxID=545501 RepID=A0A0A1MN66_9BACI|nr:ABC transporter permease [Oceanobacillus oncorhynchi]CEI80541.1 Bacitracin export permease protein BceB [Oceanobacillus oncorhynchi]